MAGRSSPRFGGVLPLPLPLPLCRPGSTAASSGLVAWRRVEDGWRKGGGADYKPREAVGWLCSGAWKGWEGG